MKEMKEYEAEVRRRIGEKTDQIKRTRRTLGVILPLVLCLVIVTVAAVPALRGMIGKKVKKALDSVNIVQPVEAVDGPDLMDGITPDKEIGENAVITEESRIAAADFAVRLFKECETEGENTLVSPLSVMCALSMTANGAAGETLAEMALAWILHQKGVTSVLVGASSTAQLEKNLRCVNAAPFDEEL